ncbi:hypothetical protein [Quadrisphaera setariae]|uniref:Uncharacterized protein n=1 Tax=Quadrisphaera setariae TaxID=2593304 RepID=A0A5C8ZG24_9ACTN|nr:hypothetical protein [Quadrisphaera setariae]TXR55760.1 hypothetical protein FMM08_13130 [Quadrisphaera setariae]
MGTFDIHSDLFELEPLRAPAGLAATGLFTRMGSWTSAHGRTGYVPDEALEAADEDASSAADAIDRLVKAGLWRREGGGYRMLRGPHADPDQALPLWRYSDGDSGGRLIAVDDAPDN